MPSHDGVVIRLPREDEFSYLVGLRNRERRWFGDQAELAHDDAVAWLATRHDEDRLLCIVSGDVVVGTIGWVRVSAPGRIYELGRVIADYRAVRRGTCNGMQLRRAMRMAYLLALDHLFGTLHADAVCGRTRPENGLARNVLQEFGVPAADWTFPVADGEVFDGWYGTAADWFAHRERAFAMVRAAQV